MTQPTLSEQLRQAAIDIRNYGTPSQVGLSDEECIVVADALDAKDAQIAELTRQLEFVGTSDQWHQRESETQEALQKIGEEFGVLGGEPRVDGIRRVLTEQREQIAGQLVDAAIADLETKIPGAFWHVAKGRLRAGEPLYAALVCFGEKEIGHFETDAGVAEAICGATADALSRLTSTSSPGDRDV